MESWKRRFPGSGIVLAIGQAAIVSVIAKPRLAALLAGIADDSIADKLPMTYHPIG